MAPLILAVNGMWLGIMVPAYAQDVRGSDADNQAVERVARALRGDSTLDAKHIAVSMDKGDVVLSGNVPSNREILDAERIAAKAAGGHKVVDNLAVEQNYPNAP
jgi:osmotically-inducible protein OsmY